MEVKKYDLFSGGISQMIEDLEENKNQLKTLNEKISHEIASELIRTIQSEAESIDYNYEAYSSVYNDNVVESGLNGKTKVKNTNQQATYSEYGTGIIGSQTPHPDNRIGWQYDVNEHGEKGWVYNLNGQYIHTKGLPSNPVYWRSARLVRQKIPLIVKRVYQSKNNE